MQLQREIHVPSAQLPKAGKPEEYDLVILGGGTGSTIAAWTFATQGQHVAVIDRKYIGGSCPNIACLPSKNIIHSAKVASYVRRSEEFGIDRDSVTVDMPTVRDHKRRMVSGLNELYLGNYKKTGAEFICGSRPLHRSANFGGHTSRRNKASTPRNERDR